MRGTGEKGFCLLVGDRDEELIGPESAVFNCLQNGFVKAGRQLTSMAGGHAEHNLVEALRNVNLPCTIQVQYSLWSSYLFRRHKNRAGNGE